MKKRLYYADHKRVDDPMVSELVLAGEAVMHGQNMGPEYARSTRRAKAIKQNLLRKAMKGKYDPHKAVKIFEYLADDLSNDYLRGDTYRPGKATRREVARHLATDFTVKLRQK